VACARRSPVQKRWERSWTSSPVADAQPTTARPWNVSAAEPVLDRQTGYTTEVTDVARDQGEPIGQHN
jgi:hypothetical protein